MCTPGVGANPRPAGVPPGREAQFTFRNICSSSPLTKESNVEHKSWGGWDGFPTRLSPTAGPEGAGNGLSGVYHSQAELRAAGLTAWPCGGDVRRCGRGPRRGDLAFVLQTQSHALCLFICRMGITGLQTLLRGHEAQAPGEGRLGPAHLGIPKSNCQWLPFLSLLPRTVL